MNKLQATWIVIFSAVLIWSGIGPHDYPTWLLEVVPAIIAAAVLWFFPLTRLTYILILIHCIILMVGGHYTYAEVPLGDWIKDAFDQTRNNYDKLGHFAQGFVPAIVAREILIRKNVVNYPGWREWWVALLSAEAADAFLGTQGYIWDTQSDMWLALLGAVSALVFLSRLHDKQLRALD